MYTQGAVIEAHHENTLPESAKSGIFYSYFLNTLEFFAN